MTPTRRAILDQLADDDEVMFFEPPSMDVAILGLSLYQPSRECCVVYDYQRLVRFFQASGMSVEDAEEWLSFNVVGAWLGERTPIVIERLKTR